MISAAVWLKEVVDRINRMRPTKADLDEYHAALRADYVERGDPKDHPLNGFGWCMKHGSDCPFSRTKEPWPHE
jgi:hypothetical protein